MTILDQFEKLHKVVALNCLNNVYRKHNRCRLSDGLRITLDLTMVILIVIKVRLS